MATLVLRNIKGSPLSNTEADNNFQYLNNALGANGSTVVPTPSGTGSPVLTNNATLTAPTLSNATLTAPSITSATLVSPALGTPTSGVLTNCTGLPASSIIAATGITTWLTTPTSANLLSAITDEVGTGFLTFNNNTTFTGTTTIASLSLTNPLSVSGGGTGATTATQALNNLLPTYSGSGTKVLTSTSAGVYSWNTHSAQVTTFTPAGNIVAGTVQAAIEELDNEKLALTGGTLTGRLTLPAGTTSVAPLRFTSGTNLTSAVSGSMEWDGSLLYITNSSNARKTLAYIDNVHYIGTTSIALNRASTTQLLTGVSIDGNATTSTSSSSVSSGGTIASDVTATTQSLGDISTKVATTEFVSLNATRPAISSIIHGGHAAGLILSEGKVYQTNCTNASLGFNYGHSIADIGSNVQGLGNAYQLFIPDDSPVVKIGNGLREYHYALTASGNLYTWGNNANGGCGVGNASPVYRPTLAATNVVTVYDNQSMNAGSGNYYYTPKLIVKKTDGYIYGCGYNGYGQLGLGDALNRSTLTQITAAGTNPKFVGNMGNYYGCLFVQKSDNTIWAAGYNGHGQLGNGNAVDQTSLVNVTTNWNNSDNTMIIQDMTGGYGYYDSGSGGAGTTVMFLDNGTSSLVKTCGYGNYGQLGNGSTANITVPATIGSLGRVTSIKSSCNGVLSVYALNTSGNLYGWGFNGQGQLADGTQVQKSSPILMSSNVVSVSTTMPTYTYQYYSQVFIKKTDGYVYGSGYNGHGELGVGDLTTKYTFTILLLPKSAHNNIKDIGYFCTAGACSTVFAITNNNTLYGWGHNEYYGVIYSYTPNNAIISPLLFQLKRGE